MPDDCGNIIFLEEADGGDAGGSGFETRASVLQSDSAKGQNWNSLLARLLRARSNPSEAGGSILLFEHRGKYGEGRAAMACPRDFFWRVTGNSLSREFVGESSRARAPAPSFQIDTTSCGETSSERRWIPSA